MLRRTTQEWGISVSAPLQKALFRLPLQLSLVFGILLWDGSCFSSEWKSFSTASSLSGFGVHGKTLPGIDFVHTLWRILFWQARCCLRCTWMHRHTSDRDHGWDHYRTVTAVTWPRRHTTPGFSALGTHNQHPEADRPAMNLRWMNE